MDADLEDLLAKPEVLSIARRYFISNGFDGTLTSIGVVVGAVLTGIPSGAQVIKIGIGAAVGLATSGVWSVWEIERAETAARIQRLERAMLTDLDDTRIQREQQSARVVHAVASGIGPVIGVLVPLTPFLFVGPFGDALAPWEAAVAGVALGVGVLGAFGAYMASVASQPWYVSAARMALAGVVVAGVNVVLPG